jgi:pentatricopeptide repeat protein
MGLSDVKLFGKSLLSQPNLMASAVPGLSASSNGNVTLQQPAFSNISTPAASIGTRGALSKVYEMDSVALTSALGRVGGPYVASEGRLDMYAKCGSIEDALRVFNRMSTRNVVAWSAIILGHVKCGQWHKALELSSQMQQEGVEPNPVTFVGILNACASIEALKEGKDVHEQIIQSGWESNVSVGSSLVDMYAKCGSIDQVWRVLNCMPKCDVVAWNAMILGYAKCGQGQKALQLSCQMQYGRGAPSTCHLSGDAQCMC